MHPWLTVIMPTYCGEKWIDASLRSLVDEAVEGMEVIVIDGSPTPATSSIAKSYSNRLSLRVFERPDLQSWHSKTNFGVQLANSKHICWLGVDDVWLRGRCAAVREWIEARPSVALHLAPSAIIDSRGKQLGIWRCPLPEQADLPPAMVVRRLLVQNFIAAPAPVFRKDAWLATGGLDEKLWYTADWDIWLKLAAYGPTCYHGAVTVGFRIHGGSLTMDGSRDAADFSNQMNIVLDRHIALLGDDSKSIERAARVSIAVNCALAAASRGNFRNMLHAAVKVLGLGPAGVWRYLRDSRLADRVLPRLRAKLAGTF
jgi:glycosyltransferase involved in cell wall biosynthesis